MAAHLSGSNDEPLTGFPTLSTAKDPYPNLTKKHEPAQPAPVKHPRFVPPESIGHGYVDRLVFEALRQAFELTPWYLAVELYVHRDDFRAVADAVARVAGPELSKRVYIVPVNKRLAKRVMIDPRSGVSYLNRGTPPWGAPPVPEAEPSEPPMATIGAAPQPGDSVIDEVATVTCPECGNEQGDMGRSVRCEECGYGPMPTQPLPPADETAAGARLDAAE